MTNFEKAIKKLLRRIERAQSKGKDRKVERLTAELNDLVNQQEHADENTVVETPPSSESSESEVDQVSSEGEEESLPSGNGDAPENEGGEDASSNIEHGIIDDGPNEDDYLAGKTDGDEFRY